MRKILATKNKIVKPVKRLTKRGKVTSKKAVEVSSGNSRNKLPPAIQQIIVTNQKNLNSKVLSSQDPASEVAALATDDQIGAAAGNISTLLNQVLPLTRKARTLKAVKYYESDDLLNDLIEVKRAFTTTGLSLQAQPPVDLEGASIDQAQVTAFQSTLDDLEIGIDLPKLVDDLILDWFLTDNMILYWRIPTGEFKTPKSGVKGDSTTPTANDFRTGIPNIEDISALDPATVDWDNSLGRDILYVDIPVELSLQIKSSYNLAKKSGKSDDEAIGDLVEQGIQLKWVKAVIEGKPRVELRNEDGDYWLIRTRARKYNGLAKPSMYTIFLALEMRKLLNEGDLSTALMMKHFIMLITQGESITQGPQTGSTKNWLKKKDADALIVQFANVVKSMRVASNHTTKIEYIFPPKEMFDGQKYVSSESKIFNWSGVTQSLMSGSDDNYGAGFLKIKRMLAIMLKAREQIAILLMRFFMHPTIVDSIQTPERFLVNTVFDVNVLKEPKQLLDELKFLFESHISDPRTTARELQRDPEQLKASKLQSMAENEALHVWDAVGTGQTQSIKVPTNQGRPPNTGTTQSEITRLQAPTSGK